MMKRLQLVGKLSALSLLTLAGCSGTGEGGEGGVLVSTGQSRGVEQTVLLASNDVYAGIHNGIEVAVLYDESTQHFVGRVKDETGGNPCDVSLEVIVNGVNLPAASLVISSLTSKARSGFESLSDGTAFSEWVMNVESFTCTTTGGGEGGEGGSEGQNEGPEGPEGGSEGQNEGPEGPEGGSEGQNEGPEGPEGGSEGQNEGPETGGPEDPEETSPSTPWDQPFMGTLNNQYVEFAYDVNTSTFRGTVENQTTDVICSSRTEIHMGVGNQVIELGPTIGVDLNPDDVLNVVIYTGGAAVDTYSLHPEFSVCP